MKALIIFLFAGLFVLGGSNYQLQAASELEADKHIMKPCSSKPNCVSSEAPDEDHFIQPIIYTAPDADAWKLLKTELLKLPRTKIVKENEHYIHAESLSKTFGFVDDLEFSLRSKEKKIAVRSSARSGYYDFNVNRKRIEELRTALIKAGINSCPEIELED